MKFWYSEPSIPAYLLSPLAGIYRLFASAKFCAYRKGLLKSRRFPVPVIVVGNITVGGAGKTPLVIALAKALADRGYKPGIVSRGHKSKSNIYPLIVDKNSSVFESGDEPLLIAQVTEMPVVIDPNRSRGLEKLLAEFAVDVVLTDDGLQHYRLARDIEVVVIDGERRFGNGFCLPAGPLREPMSRLTTVDFMVANGEGKPGEEIMRLTPASICNLIDKHLELRPSGQEVHAVAGIGHPERFFNSLRQQGFKVIPHAFPDHHWFKPKEIIFNDHLPVIMTEKDAVKCFAFAGEQHWLQKINICISETYINKLVKLLEVKRQVGFMP